MVGSMEEKKRGLTRGTQRETEVTEEEGGEGQNRVRDRGQLFVRKTNAR
jgi:hypothetical protein